MTEPTIGEVVDYLEAQRGDPVRVMGMEMRWGATVKVDDAGSWSVVDEADWCKALRGDG